MARCNLNRRLDCLSTCIGCPLTAISSIPFAMSLVIASITNSVSKQACFITTRLCCVSETIAWNTVQRVDIISTAIATIKLTLRNIGQIITKSIIFPMRLWTTWNCGYKNWCKISESEALCTGGFLKFLPFL